VSQIHVDPTTGRRYEIGPDGISRWVDQAPLPQAYVQHTPEPTQRKTHKVRNVVFGAVAGLFVLGAIGSLFDSGDGAPAATAVDPASTDTNSVTTIPAPTEAPVVESTDDVIVAQLVCEGTVYPRSEGDEMGVMHVTDDILANMDATFTEVEAALAQCPEKRTKVEKVIKVQKKDEALEKGKRLFYSGTYRVGKDIKPGTYYITKPGSCYWERQDRNGKTIDNYFSDNPSRVQVTIRANDYAFNSDCGTDTDPWRPVS
jgi:hypothetical protein